MKAIVQTLFGAGQGNCLQAALASVLECPLESVPDFAGLYDMDWFNALFGWLTDRSCGLLYFEGLALPGLIANCYGIMGVSVAGTNEHHAVVVEYIVDSIEGGTWACHAHLVHDPNPFPSDIEAVLWHLVIVPPHHAESSADHRPNEQ